MNFNKNNHIKTYKKSKYREMYKDFEKLSADKLAINLIKPNSKVLSCGCGDGREVKFLVQEKNCEVVAIDRLEEMIESSKKEEPNAEYYLRDMVDFKTKEKQDYILCICNGINALFTLERRRLFLQQCKKNLKPTGKLILVTSHKYSYWRHFFSELKHQNNYNYPPVEIEKWFENIELNYEKLRVGKFNIIIVRKIIQ